MVGGGDGVVVIRPKKGNRNGPTPTPTTNSTTTESGLGDIWTSLTYEVQSFPTDIGYLDFTAKIKISARVSRELNSDDPLLAYRLRKAWSWKLLRTSSELQSIRTTEALRSQVEPKPT